VPSQAPQPVEMPARPRPEPPVPSQAPQPVELAAQARPEPRVPSQAPQPVELAAKALPEPRVPSQAPQPVEVVAKARPVPRAPSQAPQPKESISLQVMLYTFRIAWARRTTCESGLSREYADDDGGDVGDDVSAHDLNMVIGLRCACVCEVSVGVNGVEGASLGSGAYISESWSLLFLSQLPKLRSSGVIPFEEDRGLPPSSHPWGLPSGSQLRLSSVLEMARPWHPLI
jgi:hypothetical protein